MDNFICLLVISIIHLLQVPEFDNLYLDMNGIIHNCSHPNDDDPHFRISEETIIKNIFHYLEVIISLISISIIIIFGFIYFCILGIISNDSTTEIILYGY